MTRSGSANSSGLASGPGRREARERAIGLIYEAETKGQSPHETLLALPAEPMAYASALVTGVAEHSEEIDELIEAHAEGWHLGRMPAVDRALLRVAVFELRFRPDVPLAVILDEAVDIAKDYSTENSGRFVNGVLASIADEVRGGNASVVADVSPDPENS